MSLDKIFVQIASYRDPECIHTVRDLFAKASFPERVFVGICNQIDPAADADFILPAIPRVRVTRIPLSETKGAGWARNEAQKLWQGETYTLQIHAHMRFQPAWDELLLRMLAQCPTEKSALTGWLPGYEPPRAIEPKARQGLVPRLNVSRAFEPGDPQIVHLNRSWVKPQDEMLPTPFYVGNFLFARSGLLNALPFDPHILFWGEEINYSARLWTHGVNLYQPMRPALYHYWDRLEAKKSADYRNYEHPANQRALKRNYHLLGLDHTEEKAVLAELDHYALGTKRTLESFWRYAGLDPAQSKALPMAKQGTWPSQNATSASPSIFVAIASYRDPETQATLDDMWAKASLPQRVHAGVCLQLDAQEDAACRLRPHPQLRVQQVPHQQSRGANWARAQAMQLRQQEDFILQIDSHMRFEPGWDEALIEMLKRCPSERAVLSTYVPRYTPPDNRESTPGHLLRIRVHQFAEEGSAQLLHLTRTAAPLTDRERVGLYRSPFCIANFLFAPASVFEEVPIDPHIQFWGDEITYSARLWTHGIDIYQPDRVVAYHYWRRDELVSIQPYRRQRTPDAQRSLARVRHLLGFAASPDPKATEELARYSLGSKRSLASLWAFAGVNWHARTIASGALKGIWNFTPAPAQHPRIFVNIASYRDPECQWTVKDLFEKATYPDRVFVGICWQFDPAEDKHCFEVTTRPEQVRVDPWDWRQAEGVCWARWRTQKLWEGEEYTLMIDSHMRFVPGWDELMLAELAACDSGKPVLSCSPVPYTPPNNLDTRMNPTVRRVKPFFPDGNIRGQGEQLDVAPQKPLRGAFINAGFCFSRSEILREVPYDPYLYFDQEEITYALRIFTHGWDIFSPRRQFLYHYYNVAEQSVRPLHWSDVRKEDTPRIRFFKSRGLKRFNHLTEHQRSEDPEVVRELDQYGLGSVRTLSQFEQFTGIDFKKKIASEKALRAQFIEGLERYRKSSIRVPEIDGKNPPPRKKPRGKMSFPIAQHLDIGDCLPFISVRDDGKRTRNLESYAGQRVAMFFLPLADKAWLKLFFAQVGLWQKQASHLPHWLIFVLAEAPGKLSELKQELDIGAVLTADKQKRLANLMGVPEIPGGGILPTAFFLRENLQIEQRIDCFAAPDIFEKVSTWLTPETMQQAPAIISAQAPVLMVPSVLSPELCRHCIEAFSTGKTFEGTVGAGASLAYRPNTKVRTDHVMEGDLLRTIDEQLSRNLFPEIEKAYGFKVSFRERYKIGCYEAEKGGFFRQHRDNFEPELGYRRLAMTINLNDDYEGGGVNFPEYGNQIYRPPAGGAIIFSCQSLHQALKVTGGKRFIIVGFFHGDEDEAFRRSYLASQNKPLNIEHYTPQVSQDFHALSETRGFFKEWRRRHNPLSWPGIPAAPAKKS